MRKAGYYRFKMYFWEKVSQWAHQKSIDAAFDVDHAKFMSQYHSRPTRVK